MLCMCGRRISKVRSVRSLYCKGCSNNCQFHFQSWLWYRNTGGVCIYSQKLWAQKYKRWTLWSPYLWLSSCPRGWLSPTITTTIGRTGGTTISTATKCSGTISSGTRTQGSRTTTLFTRQGGTLQLGDSHGGKHYLSANIAAWNRQIEVYFYLPFFTIRFPNSCCHSKRKKSICTNYLALAVLYGNGRYF